MNIKLILKGFIVGLGKIIPGVSGSLLAFALGIYENIIDAVTNFFEHPKEHIKLLFNFGLGVFIAIILFSKFILFLLNHYYSATMYLFLGLIIGTIIPFTKELKINKKNTITFLITLTIILIISKGITLDKFVYERNFLNYLYTSFLGMIDAFTSIVPGISGTAIFMMLGSYEFVLSILASPFSLEFILYGIGLILGIIMVCYLMSYLLKKKKEATYTIIFAFMISSSLILLNGIAASFNLGLLFLFLFGIVLGYLLDK